jgi:uncharacterized protein YuzE
MSSRDDPLKRVEENIRRGEEQLASGDMGTPLEDISASTPPVYAELPGTEASVLYLEEAQSLYVRLRADISGVTETVTVIESPLVNVDLRDGEAVGIEILLAKKDEGVQPGLDDRSLDARGMYAAVRDDLRHGL